MQQRHLIAFTWFSCVALLFSFGCQSTADTSPTDPVESTDPPVEGELVSSKYTIPGEQPLACDWYWARHYLFAVGSQNLPRPKYYSKCENPDSGETEVYVSLSVGQSRKEPPFETSGMMLRSVLSGGKLEVREARHFPECLEMQGVATSDDCSRVAAICNVPPGSTMTADVDVSGDDEIFDELSQVWLYEWNDGEWTQTDPPSEPYRVIVHKRVKGANRAQLRYGQAEDVYGIATTVKTGGLAKHDNQALFVVAVERDAGSTTFTKVTERGWDDLCGGVHAGHIHRMAYHPDIQRFAAVCTSDHERASANFRMRDARAHVPDEDRVRKYSFHRQPASTEAAEREWYGGGGPLVPVPGGGFLASVVGSIDEEAPYDPMAIGVARIDADGKPLSAETGEPIEVEVPDAVSDVVKWVVNEPHTHLAYPALAYLGQPANGDHRYLVGWGVMRDLDDPLQYDDDLRLAYSYHVMEIDAQGKPYPATKTEIDAGWGDLDDLVSLGNGQVAWIHTTQSKLVRGEEMPPCSVNEVQFNVYTSSSFLTGK